MSEETRGAPHAPPTFREGKYEYAITRIREALRQENDDLARKRFVALTRELLPRIETYAHASLGRYGRDLPQEGIAETLILLWKRLRDSRHRDDQLGLEQRFQLAFKTLMFDACKSVRTIRFGLTEKKGPVEQLDAELFREDEDATTNTRYDVPDVDASRAMYAAWGEETTTALLTRVPNQQFAIALQMEMDGHSRDEIAAHFGKTVRTIYNWTEQAKATLKAYYQEKYAVDVHGRPIVD